mgnify:CR=1 FL=1
MSKARLSFEARRVLQLWRQGRRAEARVLARQVRIMQIMGTRG